MLAALPKPVLPTRPRRLLPSDHGWAQACTNMKRAALVINVCGGTRERSDGQRIAGDVCGDKWKGCKGKAKREGRQQEAKGLQSLQCHCCQQYGHRTDQCPHQREECKTCGGYGLRQLCNGKTAAPQPGGKGG